MLSGFKRKMLRGARRNDGNRDRASWGLDDQRRAYRIPGAAERAPSGHTFQASVTFDALITSAFEHRRAFRSSTASLAIDAVITCPHQCRVEREPGLTLGNFAVREFQGDV
jgi:hypothetical protein